MIALEADRLVFSFSEIHPKARLSITFERTLRIPDDGSAYPLPPGLGEFPLRHVDDCAKTVPKEWIEHGGVMLPMYQSEAMWLSFSSNYVYEHEAPYPFAVKIATGKIDAVSGRAWKNGLHKKRQDYVVAPKQPWIDGYCVEKGYIRQFVAMPLGSGYSVEEQVTGKAEHGGLQIAVYPMKRDVFERRFPKASVRHAYGVHEDMVPECCLMYANKSMGLSPGGRMRQEIYEDPYDFQDWDRDVMSRCFVHIANSLVWRDITGENPPTTPFTAEEYTRAGLPWFEYYDDQNAALEGSSVLSGLSSVAEMAKSKGTVALPENESVKPDKLVKLRKGLAAGQVREWTA
jgi:hypothetical protein